MSNCVFPLHLESLVSWEILFNLPIHISSWVDTIVSTLLRASLEKIPSFLSLAELPKVPSRSGRKSVEDECAGVH